MDKVWAIPVGKSVAKSFIYQHFVNSLVHTTCKVVHRLQKLCN